MVDSTDSFVNQGYVLRIENVRDVYEQPVIFKAFLTNISDNFESAWNETSVYARMDPIYTFQNTKRTIDVSFTIPAYGPIEARANQEKLSALARFLYPTYNISQGIATMSASPLFRVKFVNLIQNSQNGEGLLGVIQGFNFSPNVEMGFFPKEQEDKMGAVPGGQLFSSLDNLFTSASEPILLFPKEYELSFTLNVLHEHVLGYSDQSQRFRAVAENFPFRVDKADTSNLPEEAMSQEEIDAAKENLITSPGGGNAAENAWKGAAWDGDEAAPWDGENAAPFYDPNKPFGGQDTGGF